MLEQDSRDDGAGRLDWSFGHDGIVRTGMRDSTVVVFSGACLDFLAKIPDGSVDLIVTSPPYNIGKEYEKRMPLAEYLAGQREVIGLCAGKLSSSGSICWQVGNFVDDGAIVPLDMEVYPIFKSCGMRLRNRIVWQFGAGLHCSRRLSGRYETISWYTKSDGYTFNLDPVRVPQKYPNKRHYAGKKKGQPSCNPLGKNPSDVWDIPNVKHNHIEKTEHPAQFPVELVERLVLMLTDPGDVVLDPYAGSGSSMVAAAMHGRHGLASEIDSGYVDIMAGRLNKLNNGILKTRPMDRPVGGNGSTRRGTDINAVGQASLETTF